MPRDAAHSNQCRADAQAASGAVRESILRRLEFRDRKTDAALRLAPMRSLSHTAWARCVRYCNTVILSRLGEADMVGAAQY